MTQFFLSLTRNVRMGSRAAIAALGLIVASSADATPFLSADSGPAGVGNALGICTPPGGAFTSTGAPVSSHAVCAPNGFGEGSALATASIGNLGAEARGRHFGFGTGIGMTGTAAYSDTVVFSGPGSDPVPVRMNLHFGGSVNSDIGGGRHCVRQGYCQWHVRGSGHSERPEWRADLPGQLSPCSLFRPGAVWTHLQRHIAEQPHLRTPGHAHQLPTRS